VGVAIPQPTRAAAAGLVPVARSAAGPLATRQAILAAGPQPALQTIGAAAASAIRRSRPQALAVYQHSLS
jgi:hypothetical protein